MPNIPEDDVISGNSIAKTFTIARLLAIHSYDCTNITHWSLLENRVDLHK